MSSSIYFATAKQSKMEAAETLPCKLDLILAKLKIRERVKDERVAIKMHVGGNVGYSTIHPVFVRRVVREVLEGGGKPFVTDTSGAALTAHERGYTQETLGCPVFPAGGPDEKYFYTHKHSYKNMEEWHLAGHLEDATFLIDLAHVKGHPSCSYGGAIKNLALGSMIATTRGAIHDAFHYDQYWFPEKCPDTGVIDKIIESCPLGALVRDKDDPAKLHLHNEPCNQCGRCLEVAPAGALKIDPINFRSFQEACAISTKICLDTFDREKTTFINIANIITPVCDCFGFTGPPTMLDLGVLGSDDMVALEQATLDLLAPFEIIREFVPAVMEVQPDAGHPFQQLHGPYKDPYIAIQECEKFGLGSREYELIDLLPYEPDVKVTHNIYISAADM